MVGSDLVVRQVADQVCTARRWSRDRLAAELGVGRSTLFAWLNGSATPTPSRLARLADLAGVPVGDLAVAAGVVGGSQLAVARAAAGWSQAQLATMSGVSALTIAQAESGRRVRTDAAARIAAALADPTLVAALSVTVAAGGRVGVHLEAARVAHGWTVAELGRRLGVSRQMASAWIHGVERVPPGRAGQVADLLGVPVARVRGWMRADRAGTRG